MFIPTISQPSLSEGPLNERAEGFVTHWRTGSINALRSFLGDESGGAGKREKGEDYTIEEKISHEKIES